jgi:hypothetical protein
MERREIFLLLRSEHSIEEEKSPPGNSLFPLSPSYQMGTSRSDSYILESGKSLSSIFGNHYFILLLFAPDISCGSPSHSNPLYPNQEEQTNK